MTGDSKFLPSIATAGENLDLTKQKTPCNSDQRECRLVFPDGRGTLVAEYKIHEQQYTHNRTGFIHEQGGDNTSVVHDDFIINWGYFILLLKELCFPEVLF